MVAPQNAVSARRQFLEHCLHTGAAVGLLGLLGVVGRPRSALSAPYLRPPGALASGDFEAACIRCGLCVQACPYEILHLADLGDPQPAGTPYFVAREGSCEMCEQIPCVPVCPTGALDHQLEQIDAARMGLAVLVDQENCLNMQGLRCDVCYRVCPLLDEAISLELQRNARTGKHARFVPTVHSERCTGCGKCEQACVLEVAAIKVLPLELARGALGAHYRFGWQEQAREGHALIPEPIDLPDRRPEVRP